MEQADVLVIGGGPAGAATAIRLARAGRAVVLAERLPAWRWRASGVFASPAVVPALAALGLDEPDLASVTRRIPAMRVETRAGTRFRLTYGDDGSGVDAAVGLDRSRLDPLLLDRAARAGVEVRRGVTARPMELGRVALDGAEVRPRIVVGADGLRSSVARAFGVSAAPPLGGRVALSFHVDEPGPEWQPRRDARMVVFDGGYVGLAPVPGGRVNVGIVLVSARWRARLAAEGGEAVARAILAAVPPAADDPVDWANPHVTDRVEGVAPVGARVTRRAGAGWLLVGDAAGFLDPFTGEGLFRALRSAELAAAAVDRHLAGNSVALEGYARSVARRTQSKDLVSRVVQGFLAVPPAFDYAARRLADRGAVRETMGLVMGDLIPASRALDPRFLVALLRP